MIIQGFRFDLKDGKKVYGSMFPLDETREYACNDCGHRMLLAKTMPEFLADWKGTISKFQCMHCMQKEAPLK